MNFSPAAKRSLSYAKSFFMVCFNLDSGDYLGFYYLSLLIFFKEKIRVSTLPPSAFFYYEPSLVFF